VSRAARALIGCALALALAGSEGCSSTSGAGPDGGGPAPGSADGGGAGGSADGATSNLGTISVTLHAAAGVKLGALSWTVSNATLLASDRTGAVDLSSSQDLQFVVSGLPAGDGYTITVNGVVEPSGLNCTGSATPFTVIV
jgi:hypothetical protein